MRIVEGSLESKFPTNLMFLSEIFQFPFSLDFSAAVILLFPLTKNIKQKTAYIQPFGCTPLQRTLGISCLLKVLVCCSFLVIFEK